MSIKSLQIKVLSIFNVTNVTFFFANTRTLELKQHRQFLIFNPNSSNRYYDLDIKLKIIKIYQFRY